MNSPAFLDKDNLEGVLQQSLKYVGVWDSERKVWWIEDFKASGNHAHVSYNHDEPLCFPLIKDCAIISLR